MIMREMKSKEQKAAGMEENGNLDETAVASISNWAFAWLFQLAEFGEDEEEYESSPSVSW